MRILLASLTSFIFLSGCTLLPGLAMREPLQIQVNTQTVFVDSLRSIEEDGTYGPDRQTTPSLRAYSIAIPTERKITSLPKENTSLGMQFELVLTAEHAAMSAFSSQVISHARTGTNDAEILVFVHGFNTTFEHSINRLAQITHDIDLPGTPVLFDWPSSHNIISYSHDLDSSAFARDALVELLDSLSQKGASRIVLVGHSMGARLAIEAVRQMRIADNQRFFNRFGGLVMLAPDIDLDLFNIELQTLRGIDAPIIAYISHDDDLLRNFANTFNEGQPRLGSVEDVTMMQGQRVTLIDVAHVRDPDSWEHFPLASSLNMISSINAMRNPGLVTYALQAAKGEIGKAQITRFGQSVHVLLSQY